MPSTSGPWWAARPSTPSDPSTDSTSTLDGLADPLLGALGVELLDQGGDVLGPRADLVLVELAVVGLAPRCRPRRSSRTRRSRPCGRRSRKSQSVSRSSSVSPGNPTITLDRTPAAGARVADPLEQAQEALRVAEAAHPAQHGGAARAGRRGRSRARRRGSTAIASTRPGPGLGRLEVGDPDPLDALDGRQLGQQRLEQPQVAEVLAVGRGVLADQEQLADALGRRATAPPAARRSGGGSRTSRGRSGSRRTSSGGRSRWPA